MNILIGKIGKAIKFKNLKIEQNFKESNYDLITFFFVV